MLVIFLNSHCSTSDAQGDGCTPQPLPLAAAPQAKKRASVREPAGDRGVYWQQNDFFLFGLPD